VHGHALFDQADLFEGTPSRPPVLAAWGAGTDSTAMLIEMIENGEPVDQVLFADTGDEHPRTYAFIPIFRAWLEERSVTVTIVRNEVRDFKQWPPYATLGENCITNGTLPSIAFGFSSCSKNGRQRHRTAGRDPGRRHSESGPLAARW
jgi:hypothetical protein